MGIFKSGSDFAGVEPQQALDWVRLAADRCPHDVRVDREQWVKACHSLRACMQEQPAVAAEIREVAIEWMAGAGPGVFQGEKDVRWFDDLPAPHSIGVGTWLRHALPTGNATRPRAFKAARNAPSSGDAARPEKKMHASPYAAWQAAQAEGGGPDGGEESGGRDETEVVVRLRRLVELLTKPCGNTVSEIEEAQLDQQEADALWAEFVAARDGGTDMPPGAGELAASILQGVLAGEFGSPPNENAVNTKVADLHDPPPAIVRFGADDPGPFPTPLLGFPETSPLTSILAQGECAILAGEAGIGKSGFTAGLAVGVALAPDGVQGSRDRREAALHDAPLLFRKPGDTPALVARGGGGGVLMCGYEDRPAVVHEDLRRAAAAYGVNDVRSNPMLRRISTLDMSGKPLFGPPRRGADGKDAGLINSTPERLPGWRLLEKAIDLTKPRLVIIDPLTTAFTGNPNETPSVRLYLQALRELATAKNTGILSVCHCAKRVRDAMVLPINPLDPQMVSGSSAWVDGVRGAMALTREGQSLLLTVIKSNYGPARKQVRLTAVRPEGEDGNDRRPAFYAPPSEAKVVDLQEEAKVMRESKNKTEAQAAKRLNDAAKAGRLAGEKARINEELSEQLSRTAVDAMARDARAAVDEQHAPMPAAETKTETNQALEDALNEACQGMEESAK